MTRWTLALCLMACGSPDAPSGLDAEVDAGLDAALPRYDGGWGGHAMLTWGPLDIAHRGGAAERPEHTLLAYRHALDVGADVLELDLHRSSDGAVVVMHDDTVDGTTDGSGAVAEMSLAELRALDAGHQFGRSDGFPYRGTGLTVPTLEDVLDAFPDALFLIELKANDARMDTQVVDALTSRSMGAQVVITAVSDEPLARVRALDPSIATGMSASEMVTFSLLRPSQEARYRAPAPVAAPPHGNVDSALVTKLRRFGLFLQVWTVNDEATMERLIDLGVLGIITDRPSLLEEVFTRRGLR